MPVQFKTEKNSPDHLVEFEVKNERCVLIHYVLNIIQMDGSFDLNNPKLHDCPIMTDYTLTEFVDVFKETSNGVIFTCEPWELWPIVYVIEEYLEANRPWFAKNKPEYQKFTRAYGILAGTITEIDLLEEQEE